MTSTYCKTSDLESLQTPTQCWAQDLARGLNSSRSSWMGQTSRCFIVCSFQHSHAVRLSLLNPHFSESVFRLCIVQSLSGGYLGLTRWLVPASLEPGGSDSLGLKESLCGVVWRWLDQRVSLLVKALPSRSSTEWRKLCLDLKQVINSNKLLFRTHLIVIFI